MLALLALLAAALLALLGARRAAAPGAWVPLKRWALGGLLLLYGAWKQRAACGGAAEPRRPRLLSPDPHALDSVYFTGFAETNKNFVIARLAKRPNGICEMWLFLRVDGIGEFEHPQHPNMMVNDESEEIWSGGGLTIEYLELQARWKISFNGFLRKGPYRQQWSEEEGELVPVKFSFHWENSTEVFSFRDDSHPSTFAHAFAQEPWTIEFFQRVKKQREQHFRHEQWGQSVGEIEIKNHEKTKLSLKGVRSHSYGVRNWSEIYRYVMILARFEDGTAAHLTVINMPATTTNLTVGYVFFPDGKKAGIEWSNASLAEMADDGVIKDEYRVSFTAGGKHFDVSARLDKQACPVVYNGLTGRGVFHECIADFQLDGLTQGWGLAEFYYRDEAAQRVPNLQLGSNTEGPDLSSLHLERYGVDSRSAMLIWSVLLHCLWDSSADPSKGFASIFGKGSKREEFKEEYAKVLAMEIYALLMTANGDLVEYTLEEDGRKIGGKNEVLQHGVVYGGVSFLQT